MLDEGYWLPAKDGDPRALALYLRHYSAKKNAKSRTGLRQFMPPGQKMVLLTVDCAAVFGWVKNTVERYDKQVGVCCTIFRNEGTTQSSLLVEDACRVAWRRWPGERLFTYVDPGEVASKNPGYCFKAVGWKRVGKSKKGLHLLERLP